MFRANQANHSLLDNLPLQRRKFVLIMKVLLRFDGWLYYCVLNEEQENLFGNKGETFALKPRVINHRLIEKSRNPFMTQVLIHILCHGNVSSNEKLSICLEQENREIHH
jgi:hypothetical protein